MKKEALKTSSIEGEVLSKKDVLSSIKKKLGLLQTNEKLRDKKAEGVAEPILATPLEMSAFIAWFNQTEQELMNHVLPAALTHLYFESLHPVEDGNGRIGRALTEKALSQCLVLFSLSAAIASDKKLYDSSLQKVQGSNEVNYR